MTQEQSSGNLSGQPLRSVRLRTHDLQYEQISFQENTIETLDTKLQVVQKKADISAVSTTKYAITSVPLVPKTPLLVPVTPILSDYSQDVVEYPSVANASKIQEPVSTNVNKGQQLHSLKQLNQFVPLFKWRIALSCFLALGVGLTAFPLPFILSILMSQVFPRADSVLFLWSLALLFGLLLLTEVLKFINRNVITALCRSVERNILSRSYYHMLRLPFSSSQRFGDTEQVLHRLNESTSAQVSPLQIKLSIVTNSIVAIMYASVLFLLDWRLTAAVVVVTFLCIGISSCFNRHSRQLRRQVLEAHESMNGVLYEGLTTRKPSGVEHNHERIAQEAIKRMHWSLYQQTIFQSSMQLAIAIVQGFGGIVLLDYGGYLVLTHTLTTGQLLTFVLILLILSFPIAALLRSNQQLQAVEVTGNRLLAMLNSIADDRH